ncbi:hypothetical protein Plhal304r1_c019g0066291 [Plasmopara halstedii]
MLRVRHRLEGRGLYFAAVVFGDYLKYGLASSYFLTVEFAFCAILASFSPINTENIYVR